MKIVVCDNSDESFVEIWELSDEYDDKIIDLLSNERHNEIYELLQENGTKIIDKCEYWIDIGER